MSEQLVDILDSVEEDEECLMDDAKMALSMISESRAGFRHYSTAIGKALYNVSDGSDEGFNMWVDFCELDDDLDAEDCEVLWSSFSTSNNYTIRTLFFYAREDSRKRVKEDRRNGIKSVNKYKQWFASKMRKLVDQALKKINHRFVADIVYHWVWLETVCVNDKAPLFYRHNGRRLVKIGSYRPIHNAVRKVNKFIENYRKNILETLCSNAPDIDTKKSIEQMIKTSVDLCQKLRLKGFQDQVCRQVSTDLYEQDFESKLDINEDIVGVANGVIELTEHEAIFRKGKFEDHITKCTNTKYDKRANEKEGMKQLDDWLSKCFPAEDEIYFNMIMTSLLKGRNVDKILPFFTGRGDNSKTMIKKLIQLTLGGYCIDFKIETFTSAGKAGGPSPELAQAKGARVAFLCESESTQTFKTTLLKLFSGDDTFFARMNRQDGGSIKPSFVIITMCNDMPKMKMDRAMINRTKNLKFIGEWISDDDPEGRKYPKKMKDRMRLRKFRMDKNFSDKIPGMAEAMLWKMVNNYAVYKKKGIQEPESVTIASKKYWSKTNPYSMFFKDNMEFVYGKNGEIDKDTIVEGSRIYSDYKDWLSSNEPSNRKPTLAAFMTGFKYVAGEPDEDGNFVGVTFK